MHGQLGMGFRERAQRRQALGTLLAVGVERARLDIVMPAPSGMTAVSREQLRATRGARQVGHAPAGVARHMQSIEGAVTEDIYCSERSAGCLGHLELVERPKTFQVLIGRRA